MIYIVDGNSGDGDKICGFLEQKNHKSVYVEKSEELLKKLDKNSSNLVIADVAIPGINGIELTKILKDNYPKTKVICMTDYCQLLFKDVIDSGADACLSKPFEKEELIECVEDVLSPSFAAEEKRRVCGCKTAA